MYIWSPGSSSSAVVAAVEVGVAVVAAAGRTVVVVVVVVVGIVHLYKHLAFKELSLLRARFDLRLVLDWSGRGSLPLFYSLFARVGKRTVCCLPKICGSQAGTCSDKMLPDVP